MPEILPATGDDLHGISYSVTTTTTGTTEQVTRTETGPADLIAARKTYWKLWSSTTQNISQIRHTAGENGRSSLAIDFVPAEEDRIIEDEEYGMQELRSFDISKDIRLAPYFAAMTNKQVDDVVWAWEQHEDVVSTWTNLQKTLYGHYAHGQASYLETCTEFVKTFIATGQKAINKAASNPNTVQTLPSLSPTMEKLIDAMPAGEWLKKPTQVSCAGKLGWLVRLTYQHAPKWSIVYGGTFTGLDA